MSIHQVTPQGFWHVCQGERGTCGKTQQGQYSQLEKLEYHGKTYLVFHACEEHSAHGPEEPCGRLHGCTVHLEIFQPPLPPGEEEKGSRDEASREQVRNVRLLYEYAGIL